MELSIPKNIETAQKLLNVLTNLATGMIDYVKGQEGPSALKELGALADPKVMGMHLLDLFLTALPPEYVERTRSQSDDRLFVSGEFKLLKYIPHSVIIETLQKADIFE
jgi:hypothetical protein